MFERKENGWVLDGKDFRLNTFPFNLFPGKYYIMYYPGSYDYGVKSGFAFPAAQEEFTN